MKSIIKRKLAFSLAAIYILSLIILMLIPIGNSSTNLNDIMIVSLRGDYLVHLLVPFPWMWISRYIWLDKFKFAWWFLLGLVLMATLELAQMWLPYRSFNINDLIAGIIGVVFSAASSMIYKRYFVF